MGTHLRVGGVNRGRLAKLFLNLALGHHGSLRPDGRLLRHLGDGHDLLDDRHLERERLQQRPPVRGDPVHEHPFAEPRRHRHQRDGETAQSPLGHHGLLRRARRLGVTRAAQLDRREERRGGEQGHDVRRVGRREVRHRDRPARRKRRHPFRHLRYRKVERDEERRLHRYGQHHVRRIAVVLLPDLEHLLLRVTHRLLIPPEALDSRVERLDLRLGYVHPRGDTLLHDHERHDEDAHDGGGGHDRGPPLHVVRQVEVLDEVHETRRRAPHA